MNLMSTSPQTGRLPVERRRRWKKRRELDRAFRLAGVGRGERLAVDPSAYDRINVCSCTSQSNNPRSAPQRGDEHSTTSNRSKKEVT